MLFLLRSSFSFLQLTKISLFIRKKLKGYKNLVGYTTKLFARTGSVFNFSISLRYLRSYRYLYFLSILEYPLDFSQMLGKRKCSNFRRSKSSFYMFFVIFSRVFIISIFFLGNCVILTKVL